MGLARSSDDFIRDQADRWVTARHRKLFARLPAPLQRELIQRQLHELGQIVDFEMVESLRIGQTVQSAPDRSLVINAEGRVVVQPSAKPAFLSKSLQIKLKERNGSIVFANIKLDWQLTDERGMNCPRQPNQECFDADKVGKAVCLRHWKPGDRFQPIGTSAASKLQDIFTNLKVPRDERRRRLVATSSRGEIFWVEGLRIGEGFKLDKTTARHLCWRWQHLESPGQVGSCTCAVP